MRFRHEVKHRITYADLLALRSRLSSVLARDAHAVGGRYEVRSLYFDNVEDKALQEKLDGVNCREKFRIRYYNGDTSLILLEKKSKINGLCSKAQARIDRGEARAIAIGDFAREGFEIAGRELLRELCCKMDLQGLRPRIIVDYTREAFVYAPGNVRVTLDYDIRTGMDCTDFLNPGCVTVPVRDRPIILEVKWDEFLPSVVADLVQTPATRTAAFSKYAACRIYS